MNHQTKGHSKRQGEDDSAWQLNQGDLRFAYKEVRGHREFVYTGRTAQHKMSMRETKPAQGLQTQSPGALNRMCSSVSSSALIEARW